MADFDDKLNQILSNPDAMAQIARLARSLNGPDSGNASPDGASAKNTAPDSGSASNSGGAQNASDADRAGVSDAVTPPGDSTVARLLPLLQELGGDSDARRLLYALRPYLRPQKQEKVERALQLARLFRVGKKFLSQWEG